MSGDKILYDVPFLSPTGVAFLADNSRLGVLQRHLEKKFPKFKFVEFGARPMKNRHSIPISFVRMSGTVSEEEGAQLVRAEVEQFVQRWIQENNQRRRNSR